MKKVLLLFFSFVTLSCYAQKDQKFNLGFEHRKEEKGLPDGWFPWGSYGLSTDSLSHSGKYAGKITADESGAAFGSIAYRIPAKYKGSKIKLAGYMKTKDVQDGHAGLLLRIDGQGKSLAFDNMQDQKIIGTHDWTRYEIILDYPQEAETIFVAGILTGKGEAWFDDFVLTIDGKDVQTLPEIEVELPKAKLDTAFNKGSSIVLSPLTATQLDNLTLLGKIWGFLKYHHREIAKGNYNWDYELFRFLPEYMAVDSKGSRDELLINWIASLGEVPACESCIEAPLYAHLKPDLSWIRNQQDDLKKALQYIYKNRVSDKHYYIEMAQGVGNPNFKNEDAYSQMTHPDDGFRLLSLFRYWNMINYFFPYKHLTDKNWDTVLKEYIPIFLDAKDELAYELATLQIIADVRDTHANLSGHTDKVAEWKGLYFPGVRTQFIEDQLTVTEFNYAEMQDETGLAIGDVIHQIDGRKIADIVAERLPYYPASNKTTQLRNLGPELLRSNKQTVEIEFTGAQGTKQTKILELYNVDSLKKFTRQMKVAPQSYKMLANNIGYITLQTIEQEDIAAIKENFKNASGIIIDIRNYPATFVPFSLGSYFVSTPTPFVKFTGGSVANPGVFTMSESLEIPNEDVSYDGPVVVLVNEMSVSQSEYTAMAFRAGKNTTIMGSTTAGADGNVSEIWLPGGLRTMISGIGVYYPDGTETQRVGIIPDIEVKPTIDGIRNGRDEPLEKAIGYISSKMAD
ncbi:S41 family peptidase [Sphingobacterium chuzhouense]|uniref:Peptidase S41 n=1 Tax=Sphingobacterium chuzhouense TaxID=1742264 RepID=A0ABR7XR30_9SPHI|nr:S41 family peptidase [Sphingobacterium chuzhouense]MBD1421598.1 peptidase S41 [Sphingobacterium chuzhouense]